MPVSTKISSDMYGMQRIRLYAHIPYCVSKCAYCGFYSVTDPPPDDLPECLLNELSCELGEHSGFLECVYLGGGTPSLPADGSLLRFSSGLRKLFGGLPTEFSIEANPADITEGKAEEFAAAGITRVSVGAQSFNGEELVFLGRRHSAADTEAAVKLIKRAGIANIGLDLICGIPGASEGKLLKSVCRALELGPSHVSLYTLSVEPGTKFAEAGVIPPPDDEVMEQMASASAVLEKAGLERYEISNFAKPGYECVYNLEVWRGGDYLGIGPSAASRIGRLRRTNIPDVRAWAAACRISLPPPRTEETLSETEDRTERMATGARLLREGFEPPADTPEPVLKNLLRNGIIARVKKNTPESVQKFVLTARGAEVADAVVRELF